MSEEKHLIDSDDDSDPDLQKMEEDNNLLSHAENKAITTVRQQQIREVKDKLYSQLKSNKPEPLPFASKEDILNEQYIIDCDSPLHEFSHGEVKAYVATDNKSPEKKLFAVICHPHYPHRKTLMEKLHNTKYDEMVILEDYGKINFSITGDYRFAIIFTQPKGKKLSDILKENGNLSEEIILEQIIKPLFNIVISLNKLGFCHGRINTNNIYIGNYGCSLGECLSDPCGMSQDFICETPERITCSTYSKGNGNIKVDLYALGVVAIECLYGINKIRKISKPMFSKLIMESIPYHLLAMGRKIPADISDFIIGSLAPNAHDRWGLEYLKNWLAGKRYNLIQMSSDNEASRPFEFDKEHFSNCRSLVYSYQTKWNIAKETIRHNNLSRWLELSMHKKDVSEQYQKAIKMTGGTDYKANKYNSELLARTIIILEPYGPLRLQGTSLHINGLGCAVAHGLLSDTDQNELNDITSIVSFDLLTFQTDLNEKINTETIDIMWKIGKIRNNLLKKNIGFGIERYLYDLNQEIPCMSKKIKEFYAITIPDVLLSLNYIAYNATEDDSLLDRHIAAYIASHMNISQDIKFNNLQSFLNIANNEELITIKFLALAQDKTKTPDLQSLSRWAALRIMSSLPEIHRLKIRTILSKNIINAAENGNLSQVLESVTNPNILKKDLQGFKHAQSLFSSNRKKIQLLKNETALKENAIDLGMRLSILVSLIFFLFKLYNSIQKYFL